MTEVSVFEKARGRIMIKHVFYANLMLQTKMIPEDAVGTAATDMRVIFYSPKFISSLNTDVAMFVIVHELMHIIFRHGFRRGGRDGALWNRACDYVVNLMMKDAGFTLWDKCWYDPRFKGLAVEEVYDIISKEKKPASGNVMDDDLKPIENMDEAEQAEVEQAINQRVTQAMIGAKLQGKMPADMERILGGLMEAKVPHYEMLRRFLTQTTHDEDDWSRPNRRYIDQMYLPSQRGEAFGELVIVGDTSGSMDQEDMDLAAAEINGSIDAVNPEKTRVIWCDAKLQREEVFERGQEIVLHPKGGGGTDLRVGINHALQFNPVVIIVVTDGYSPWDNEPPPVPLIIVCSSNCPLPDWAMVARVTK